MADVLLGLIHQIPLKPEYRSHMFYCPVCRKVVRIGYEERKRNKCDCGQKLDWVNKMSDKNCSNCICSRIEYGFRTGCKYLYCMLDEPSIWRGGKQVSSNHVCKHWRNTK